MDMEGDIMIIIITITCVMHYRPSSKKVVHVTDIKLFPTVGKLHYA